MNLFAALFSRGENEVQKLVEQAARNASAPAWELVRDRAVEMSTAEARGYIRSRTALQLAAEVEATLARQGGPAASPKLLDAAKDLLVEKLLAEVAREQQAAWLRRRRAA
jgi:hypothetical protein